MKHDVTTYNTKKLMGDALKEILRCKPLSKITVSEIVQACGVNRKTFYYHFQDIYALLKWVLDEEAIGVVRHFDLLENYEDAIRFVMDYVNKNDFIRNCVRDPVGRGEMKRFFYADFIAVITSVVDEAEQRTGLSVEQEFKTYAVRFYTKALVGMLIDWAQNCSRQDYEKTVHYLTALVSATVESMLLHMNRSQA